MKACLLAVSFLLQVDNPSFGISPLLARIEDRYNRPKAMQMTFEQTVSGTGRITRKESGDLFLAKPGKMLWRYRSPEGKVFLADGKHTWFYTPASGRVEKAKIKESEDLRAPLAFLMGRLDFDRDFKEFRYRTEGSSTLITALPKSDRAPYTEVQFRVSADGEIQSLRVTGQDHSVMDFALGSQQAKPSLDPKLFVFQVPEGAEIVEVEGQ